MQAPSVAERRATFRSMHEEGCFVLPNPFDIGSARWLRHKGFRALATTSAGFAFSIGRSDQQVGLDLMLEHIRDLVEAVPDLPVNADFENGYADDPEAVMRNVRACAETGVAGLSIEDATGRAGEALYPETLALERVIAAREALAGTGVVFTARAEGMLVGDPGGLDAVCRRIEAFARAGADVLYAPFLRSPAEMSQVIAAAGGKPVNILVHADLGLSVADIAALGARRISVGSALANAAWAGFVQAVEQIAGAGSFAGFAGNRAANPVGKVLRADFLERSRG
jgi:2-methylisocitrate lyase-like PEP mutase family enzyme